MSLAAIALTASTVFSAGASIFSGFAQKSAADDQAAQLEEQARIQREETETEAQRKAEERDRFIAKQKVAFLASGIGLAGTGVVVLEETFKEFNKEIAAFRRSGAAKADLLSGEAKIKKKSGRAALIGGVLGAGTKIAGNVFEGKKAGIF